MGGQHSNATGAPLHYASPRLRKDGLHEANALATQFLQLMKQVSDGRKVDILDLQKQLLDSEREKGELQKTQGDMESRLQAAVEELKNVKEREQRAIEEYRQQLGLPPMP